MGQTIIKSLYMQCFWTSKSCLISPEWLFIAGFIKGYPPHDTGVNKGEAEVGHQGHRLIETLEKEDKSRIGKKEDNVCVCARVNRTEWAE